MKSFARIALINLALIAVMLAAAEFVFGSWVSGPDFGMLNVPRNERRVFDVAGLYPGGREITYTRNSYGFRSDGAAKPETVDVMVLGGSTTNERYVDDADTWVARLQRNFRRDGLPLTFANASVDGQTSLGHLAAIEQWLSKIPGFRPRYALVYVGINDTTLSEDEMRQFDAMRSPTPARRIRQYIMNKSAVYNLFRTVRGTWIARDAHLVHGDLQAFETPWVAVVATADRDAIRASLAPRRAAYAVRLEALAHKLIEMGAAPIFVTQRRGDRRLIDGVPHVRGGALAATGIDAEATILALYNETTLATCVKLGLSCVDLAARIEFGDGDFYDRIHTTPAGSSRIADFLYRELKDVLKPRG